MEVEKLTLMNVNRPDLVVDNNLLGQLFAQGASKPDSHVAARAKRYKDYGRG